MGLNEHVQNDNFVTFDFDPYFLLCYLVKLLLYHQGLLSVVHQVVEWKPLKIKGLKACKMCNFGNQNFQNLETLQINIVKIFIWVCGWRSQTPTLEKDIRCKKWTLDLGKN